MLNNLDTTDRRDALETLRALIVEGGYAPGDRLPPERELIFKLNVSRGTLRKALDALEREGAIWRHVGKGTFVASPTATVGMSGLRELSQQVSPMNLTRARLLLEPAIAREAAVAVTAEAMAQIRVAQQRAAQASNWDEYEAQDDAFHRSLAKATDNALLLSLFDNLNAVKRAVSWNSVVRQSDEPPSDHPSFTQHEEIASAIERHDQDAAHAAMRNHLRSVSARLFE